jgi:hypothetical protein
MGNILEIMLKAAVVTYLVVLSKNLSRGTRKIQDEATLLSSFQIGTQNYTPSHSLQREGHAVAQLVEALCYKSEGRDEVTGFFN